MPDSNGQASSAQNWTSRGPVTTDQDATDQDPSQAATAASAATLTSSSPRVADLAPGGFQDQNDSVQNLSATELQSQIGELARVGDILLFDRSQAIGESVAWKCLRWGIARAQSRMLADYGFCRDNVRDGARFVHAALLGEGENFAEMDSVCQTRQLNDVPPGTIIRIRRPKTMDGEDAPAAIGVGAWESAMVDVREKVRYPTGELFMYYGWSWQLNKLWLGRKFCDVFRTDRANTCAAAAVSWWQVQAGTWFGGERAEAWYPGRVAVSCALRTVCEIRVHKP